MKLLKMLMNIGRGTHRVTYGNQKKDGSHNHQYNRGNDRSPAQKAGDLKRRGKRS